MTKPSKQHHKDELQPNTVLRAEQLHSIIEDSGMHIEDYKEVVKPFKWTGGPEDHTIQTRIRRYRIGRQYFYRAIVESVDENGSTHVPIIPKVTSGPPFPLFQTGGITFATAEDFPELTRLTHSLDMPETLEYYVHNENEIEGMTIINGQAGRRLNGAFTVDENGIRFSASNFPTGSYWRGETSYYTPTLNNQMQNPWNPHLGDVEFATYKGMGYSYKNFAACNFSRNIYNEEDER